MPSALGRRWAWCCSWQSCVPIGQPSSSLLGLGRGLTAFTLARAVTWREQLLTPRPTSPWRKGPGARWTSATTMAKLGAAFSEFAWKRPHSSGT